MIRILILAFALGIAVAAAAYYGTAHYLGGDPPRLAPRRVDAWPRPPAGAPPHRLAARLPDLAATDAERRRAAWDALVRSTDYPHPARRPADWPLELRVLTRHVLWALYDGRPYRTGGRELRIAIADADDAPADAPADAVVIRCRPDATGSSPIPWPEPIAPRVSLLARGDARIERLPPTGDGRRAWPWFAVRASTPVDVVAIVTLDDRPPLISNRVRIAPGQSTNGE